MSDSKDGLLDKAESLAKRILERVGSKVDRKILSDEHTLSVRAIGDFSSRLEHLIESNLQDDEHGIRRVAPNRFQVLLTYEETSRLGTQYMDAMAKELTALVLEYIGNRRYLTRGPVEVEAGKDLFAKAAVVRASFEPGKSSSHKGADADQSSAGRPEAILLLGPGGEAYRVKLEPGGPPASIGRASDNAVRIDDPSLSRLHCSLAVRDSGEVIIADLGSANGTAVNGRLLGANEAHALEPGDVIEVGDFTLTVSAIR